MLEFRVRRVEIRSKVRDLKNNLLQFPYKNSLAGQLQAINVFSISCRKMCNARSKRYHPGLVLTFPLFKLPRCVFCLRLWGSLIGFVTALISAWAMLAPSR